MEFEILYAIQKLHNPVLDQLMTLITSLGNGGWFWVALALALLCIPRTRRTGAVMLVSMAAGFLLGNLALKNLVARPRPCWLDPSVGLLIPVPLDYSFPSGHSLVSFEGAFSVFCSNRRWGSALLVLAALIACSRLYLFVHFPTDVLAGALMGIGIAAASDRLADRFWRWKT